MKSGKMREIILKQGKHTDLPLQFSELKINLLLFKIFHSYFFILFNSPVRFLKGIFFFQRPTSVANNKILAFNF